MAYGPRVLGGVVIAALLALGAGARAAEGWLEVASSGRCSIASELLERRVASALVGERDAALRVAVELRDERAGTRAAVRVARGARRLGEKQLVASSCSEALEAVVAVAALAVGATSLETSAGRALPSSDATPPGVAARGERATAAASPGSAASEAPATDTPASDTPAAPEDVGLDGVALPASDQGWRWLLAAGADQGVLSAPTAIVGAGAALGVGLSEWRARLWYGLPVSFERDEDGRLDSERSDFAAAAFDHCRSFAATRWLALCAGLEARLARIERVSAPPAGVRTERERLEPGAAAHASAALVFRELGWQPRLEAGALVPVLGTSADPRWVGIRASFGAALPF